PPAQPLGRMTAARAEPLVGPRRPRRGAAMPSPGGTVRAPERGARRGITWDTPPVESTDEPQHPQYFHGTRATLRPGDLITAGHRSNYRDDVVMNHVYFTARRDGGGLAAEIAALLGPEDRKSTRLNSSHVKISYAVFCLKKK